MEVMGAWPWTRETDIDKDGGDFALLVGAR